MLYQKILKNPSYVDDLAVYCQSSNMAIIERRLQGCLDKLVTCADENGFKFSPTKTLCVHFCKKNGLQPEPNLKLYGQQLPVEEQVKFLGLFFDKKLSFIPHIKYMKDKCRKALQLLRVISSKDWASSSYHIKHFKLNILVRTCFYWLCLPFTTLTIQYGIL